MNKGRHKTREGARQDAEHDQDSKKRLSKAKKFEDHFCYFIVIVILGIVFFGIFLGIIFFGIAFFGIIVSDLNISIS
jgi:hypothetical protein